MVRVRYKTANYYSPYGGIVVVIGIKVVYDVVKVVVYNRVRHSTGLQDCFSLHKA